MSDQTSKQQKTLPTNIAWLSAAGILVLTCVVLGIFNTYAKDEYNQASTSLEQHPNSKKVETANTASEEKQLNLATAKTAQIREQLKLQQKLQQKYQKQQAKQSSSTSSSNQSQLAQTKQSIPISEQSKLDEHDSNLEHEHEQNTDLSAIIKNLSPEVILAVNEMTHQTEKGTQMSVASNGGLIVDMGDTAFRAVPVATVDEKGNVKITEFFEPIIEHVKPSEETN